MLVPVVGDILVFMKIKMISWNVRGLNDPWKRRGEKFVAGVEM